MLRPLFSTFGFLAKNSLVKTGSKAIEIIPQLFAPPPIYRKNTYLCAPEKQAS